MEAHELPRDAKSSASLESSDLKSLSRAERRKRKKKEKRRQEKILTEQSMKEDEELQAMEDDFRRQQEEREREQQNRLWLLREEQVSFVFCFYIPIFCLQVFSGPE